ncbi:putative O-linked N-acetylglucosamine transferase (SPINDLY family) [Neorhizobium galegae]|uniref:O-linked N-acetylglucosamine transferase, SPINDLY family protein n=1 Tax=Neorhizobium galegae TaxID=399 RepID=UPI001AE5B4D1|nr:glycosyl transferase [Neorhizobium galegae]MBP2548055.1 putative O-linked N-acetylglucosamine transferase (SPINDLY family) [Neorhizobium galegae]
MLSPQTLFSDASKSFHRGHFTEALTSLNKLLDHSKDAKTYSLLARTLVALGFREDAARTYVLAAELGGSRAEDHYAEAMKIYFDLGHDDLALSLGRPLLQRAQKDPELAFIITSLFMKRGEKDMVRVFLPALSMSENSQHNSLAFLLLTGTPENDRDRESVANLLSRMPNSLILIMAHLVAQREVNNYVEMERLQPRLERIASNDRRLLGVETPFYNLHWLTDEAMNKLVSHKADAFPASHPQERLTMPHIWGQKIRIGYLSSDFWSQHATMKLFRAVLAAHDPDRFEVTLFCYTDPIHLEHDTGRENWGRIVNVRDLSYPATAQVIRDHNIDILVEMKGHTRGGRPGILNFKAAPVQVAWLGFPGTTVNIDLDYIIGDHYVLPDASKPHYWEKFCRLPETYQPNDPYERPRRDLFTRADANLPDDAFVFGSFNATRKISLANINLWIKLLKATPKSVLWIMCKSNDSRDNILRKLTTAGIETRRIVFTKVVSYEEHLARLSLADVGLDTYPYNGHTTTSEQLWAGLPVLTMKGQHFASRVSESLLNAIGVPELIAKDEADYLKRAVELYENPQEVKALRARLEENRLVKPLFDAERFCRHLETAYEMMADRARQKLAPDHLDVPALPPRTAPFLIEGA